MADVAPLAVEKAAEKKTRPKQFCPVPGCQNTAAPVFGVVCKDHKNMAKSKKYRAERKATPAGAAKPAAAALAKDKGVAAAVKMAAKMRKAYSTMGSDGNSASNSSVTRGLPNAA
jgi:hypothetical protein